MIRPLFDYILIEKTEEEKKTNSGIVLASKEKSDTIVTGKVLAIGDGRLLQSGEFDKPKVSVGDKIFFPKIEASILEDNGNYYYIIRETSILGIGE
ncbi:MAG: co-chaperone GroES [Candidatus Neomarinimicrobiota bacterium]